MCLVGCLVFWWEPPGDLSTLSFFYLVELLWASPPRSGGLLGGSPCPCLSARVVAVSRESL